MLISLGTPSFFKKVIKCLKKKFVPEFPLSFLAKITSMMKLRSHDELKLGKKCPFWQDNALFASKTKINVRFLKFFRTGPRVKEKFQKTLILVFLKAIVQQPKMCLDGMDFFRVLAHCGSLCKKTYNILLCTKVH